MKIYWIDLFAGAGGTTTGIHLATVDAEVLACVNHDADAIACHKENHPNCVHFTEDVRDFDVVLKIKKLVDEVRLEDPNCIINIWASLECTHFSKAKGGLPREADSRTLAYHLMKYVEQLNPHYVYIENVQEFRTWGPLDKNGKPQEKGKGRDYLRFIANIRHYGYRYQSKMINAADLGAHTRRDRYFGVFAKDELPIEFPRQTHAQRNKAKKLGLIPWRPVKELLDFSDEGNSIFGKTKMGKPYSVKTFERVLAGLNKYAHEGAFIQKYFSGRPYNKIRSIFEPGGTVTTVPHEAIVVPKFLTSYYGNGGAHSLNDPCNTLTTKERYAAHFLSYSYSTPTQTSVEEPSGTTTTVPKQNLVSINWLYDTQYKNTGKSINDPAQTLIARMDKKPIYLACAKKQMERQMQLRFYEHPHIMGVKQFMIQNHISDVKIRMLKLSELKAIQGFPESFKLIGTKTNKLKFIGNSVVPLVAQRLAESNYNALQKLAA